MYAASKHLLQAEILILFKGVAGQRTELANLLHTIVFLQWRKEIKKNITNLATVFKPCDVNIKIDLFQEETLLVGHALQLLGVFVDLLLVVALLSLPVLHVLRQFAQLSVVALDLLVDVCATNR